MLDGGGYCTYKTNRSYSSLFYPYTALNTLDNGDVNWIVGRG
jgi:hypothetical protein